MNKQKDRRIKQVKKNRKNQKKIGKTKRQIKKIENRIWTDIIAIKDKAYLLHMDPYTSEPLRNDAIKNAVALFSAIRNHKGSF